MEIIDTQNFLEDKKALEAFVLNNPPLAKLERELAKFNIFEAIGAVKQELRHSDFLAFLLDPNQPNSLGNQFLKRLLMQVLSQTSDTPISLIEVDAIKFTDTEVLREWNNIDILIVEKAARLVVAIENKLFSGEHSDQLTRYRNIVAQEYPDYRQLFLFLTPDELPPSDDNYIAVSYRTIATVLKAAKDDYFAAHNNSMDFVINSTIDHYIEMLGRHIVSDSQIAQLCREIYRQHKRALDLIFEHRPDMQAEIAQYLRELVDSVPHLAIDHWGKSYAYFVPKSWDEVAALLDGQELRSRRWLVFLVTNLPDRLNISLIMFPGSSSLIRQSVLDAAVRNKHVFRGVNERVTAKYKTLYKLPILNSKALSEVSLHDKQLIHKMWMHFIEQDLPEIVRVIQNEVPWSELENSPRG